MSILLLILFLLTALLSTYFLKAKKKLRFLRGSSNFSQKKINTDLSQQQEQDVYVLIDDDPFWQILWQESLPESSKIRLYCFSESFEFSSLLDLPKEAYFYIDQELGADKSGLDLAKKLYEAGFYRLYLATCHSPFSIGKHDFLLGVRDKTPPWLVKS